MKNIKYKFGLGEHVYVLGVAGICIISARGTFQYLSGGIMNHYVVLGAHKGIYCEYELLTKEEMKKIAKGE